MMSGANLLLQVGTLFSACVLLVAGVRCRQARDDPETQFARLGTLKRISTVTVWLGFAAAVLPFVASLLSVGEMEPLLTLAAIVLFWVDFRLDSSLGHARSLLVIHRIDNGTYRDRYRT